jgi:DNA-binding NarL/FixJ family response regulator
MGRLREALVENPPNVLIVEVELPGGTTLDIIPELRQIHPEMGILVLSGQSERTAGVKAIIAGAHGFISKTTAPEQLIEAVDTVSRGAHYVSTTLDSALTEELRRGAGAGKLPHEAFSPREHTVMLKIARGFTTAEIAAQLGLNPRTVGAYRARILQKLRIQSTAELTRYVVQKGLDKE